MVKPTTEELVLAKLEGRRLATLHRHASNLPDDHHDTLVEVLGRSTTMGFVSSKKGVTFWVSDEELYEW